MSDRDKMLWQGMGSALQYVFPLYVLRPSDLERYRTTISQECLALASEMLAVLELKTGIVEEEQ